MSDKGEEDDRLDLSAPQPVESTKFSNRLLRAFRSRNNTTNTNNKNNKAPDNREAGMEGELINQIAKLDFKSQVKMFYTAYSKVSSFSPFSSPCPCTTPQTNRQNPRSISSSPTPPSPSPSSARA